MATQEIRIFYSWQSDLPGNQSRYIIQESIEDAVKILRDTVEIIADRDTNGELGSPDITQTIFSKIDMSDLFIADVSVINKYTSINDEGEAIDAVKISPNPNVLLELGYAAKTLGWNRVICILNADFGKIEDLPFDIAHRRLTPFSLKEKSKTKIKKELTQIIIDTVSALQINGVAKKFNNQFALHIVGGYNFDSESAERVFSAMTIRDMAAYKGIKSQLLAESKKLIDVIFVIKLDVPKEQYDEPLEENLTEESSAYEEITHPSKGVFVPLKANELMKTLTNPRLVVIKEEERAEIIKMISAYFDLYIDDTFFCMGNLHSKFTMPFESSEYDGTEEEIEKYTLFCELRYNFSRLSMLEHYVDTFNGLVLIPLAITNCGEITDMDITISILVDEETAKISTPCSELFNKEIEGLEGIIYEDGLIKELFFLPQNGNIQYDYDITFDPSEVWRKMKKANILWQSNFDSEDYAFELQKYIAMPCEHSSNISEFTVNNLHPKETKWLGASILLKPLKDSIRLSYSIKSCNSNGDLSGDIIIEIPERKY